MCGHPNPGGMTHKICSFSYSPQQTYSLFRYEGLIKKIIRKGKYKGVFTLYKEAINLFTKKSNNLSIFENSVFVPIPISKNRLKKRGYNQVDKICEYLTQTVANTQKLDLLIRTKNTLPQYSLSREDRLINMQGAIGMKNINITNQNIVIVDDILTTGATLREACKTLKGTNYKSLSCLTLSVDTAY